MTVSKPPVAGPRSAGRSAGVLVSRLRESRLSRRTPGQAPRAATWDLFKVALVVPAICFAVLAVVVTLTKLLAGGAFGGLGAQMAAGWLVLNQVPLTVGGVTVGVLPLVPTLAVIAGVAWVTARAARQAETLPEVATIAGAALAGPLLCTAIALAVVAEGSSVTTIGQAPPLPAFGHTLLVQGIGVAIAVGRRCLQPLFDTYEFPVADRVGGRGGLIAVAGLVAGGALLVTLGLVVKWGRVHGLIAEGHSFDGYLGLTLLSILYLPNVVIAALGVSVGADADAGSAVVDAISTVPGTVPPLPIMGIIPETSLGWPGGFVFLLPIAVGVLIGWYCRSVDPVKHLRAVAVAAAVCAALVVLAATMASGGAGELGRVGVSAPLAGVYAFAWIAVVGAVTAGVHALLPSTRALRADEPFDLDALLESEMFDGLEILDDDDLDAAEAPTEVLDAVADEDAPATGDDSVADALAHDPEPGRPVSGPEPGDEPAGH
ncbi:MAG: DUF6350 family protein [Gordonia sp. (in: high G+C Gram-positive bacteria)]|uniref:cell division protein PerM n=1 Tax=Gordonia sp. (in: high G+C Gram-positive bacteria) TaxID=84139 RepID=UPI0039E24A56